ncbi:MAG: S41 family peptidase [Ezakiella sp.]
MKKSKFIILVVFALVITNVSAYFLGKNSAKGYQLDFSKNEAAKDKKQTSDAPQFFDRQTIDTLGAVVNHIKKNYYKDIDNETLNTGLIKGVVNSLDDPYSEFMTKEELKKFMESTNGKYVGVGLVVSPGKDGYITVVSPIKGSPAYKVGIKSGDRIIKVDEVEYSAETMQDAVNKMRGEEGKTVSITVLREEQKQKKVHEFKIKRETIKLQTVDGRILEKNIGYIAISEFDKPTYDDFMKELEVLKKKGAQKLVLDLRGNPGGLLDVCTKIADVFLDKGTIVYTKYKDGKKDYYYSDEKKEDMPLVVLVNGGSASASEIVSGALKDRKRAKLVGTQTFGKGIVQRLFNLPYETAVKLTISEYFTPNGNNIHKVGITPDVVVELPDNIKGIGPDYLNEDTQLKKALEILK